VSKKKRKKKCLKKIKKIFSRMTTFGIFCGNELSRTAFYGQKNQFKELKEFILNTVYD